MVCTHPSTKGSVACNAARSAWPADARMLHSSWASKGETKGFRCLRILPQHQPRPPPVHILCASCCISSHEAEEKTTPQKLSRSLARLSLRTHTKNIPWAQTMYSVCRQLVAAAACRRIGAAAPAAVAPRPGVGGCRAQRRRCRERSQSGEPNRRSMASQLSMFTSSTRV